MPPPVLRAGFCSVDNALCNDGGWSTGEHRESRGWWAVGRLPERARQKPRPRGENWRWGMGSSHCVAGEGGLPLVRVHDGPHCSMRCGCAGCFSRTRAINMLSGHEKYLEVGENPNRT